MQRVLIIGCGGSGKSTLARKLAKATDLPMIHLNVEFWRPGWVEPPEDEWKARVAELLRADRWIMDGNYGSTMDERFAAADTIVFLDLPTHVCTWRIIDRALHPRAAESGYRPDMPLGCEEHLDPEFIHWVYNFRRDTRPKILARLRAVEGTKTVVTLTSSRATDEWLRTIQRTRA